jgi:hypothetical protein
VFKFFYGKEERKGKASRYSKDIFQKMLFLWSAFHVGVNDMRRVTAVSWLRESGGGYQRLEKWRNARRRMPEN